MKSVSPSCFLPPGNSQGKALMVAALVASRIGASMPCLRWGYYALLEGDPGFKEGWDAKELKKIQEAKFDPKAVVFTPAREMYERWLVMRDLFRGRWSRGCARSSLTPGFVSLGLSGLLGLASGCRAH